MVLGRKGEGGRGVAAKIRQQIKGPERGNEKEGGKINSREKVLLSTGISTFEAEKVNPQR